MPFIVHAPDQPVAWRQGKAITAASLREDALHLAKALPAGSHLVNLCEDRYHFMVGFAAALMLGKTTLMPPNNSPGAIGELMQDHPGCHCLYDKPVEGVQSPGIDIGQWLHDPHTCRASMPDSLNGDQLAAVLYTSGSTGRPSANRKSWYNLQQEARTALRHFPFIARGVRSLVATVPSQHMYGLATSILFPWQGGFAIDTGRPFFPADIADALNRLPAPRVLITTPLHLRACVSAGIEWPELSFIISATAPLSKELAEQAEQALSAEVFEIYGSTETGSVAGRRTVDDDLWQLYDGMCLNLENNRHVIQGGHLRQGVKLNDRLRIDSPDRFELIGRDSDMVKIAGKRASLADLSRYLLNIPGVDDGLFLAPEESKENARLSALVVAPTLNDQQILQALAHCIDPVFLPRPVHRVERLPRNETGKLPAAALRQLLESLGTG